MDFNQPFLRQVRKEDFTDFPSLSSVAGKAAITTRPACARGGRLLSLALTSEGSELERGKAGSWIGVHPFVPDDVVQT